MRLKNERQARRVHEGDWGEIRTATAFALIGFIIGAAAMYYSVAPPV
ncbi:uncharacterized protein METZ01_LOCUS181166 [marine metagenome]|uniref:Uncharacterized protein n=1 Tax=marine metagenome TaxID=408172 RepID=A0A382CR73_9ZZZZ